MLIEQTLYLLKTVLEQNYFQHNNQFYQSNKGITMGPPYLVPLWKYIYNIWKRNT